MEIRLYEALVIMMVYSVFGYAGTVLYNALHKKKKIRNGAGEGPYAVMYGAGGVVMMCLGIISDDNVLRIFIEGAVLGTMIEFIVGTANQKLSGDNKKFYHVLHSVLWGILSVVSVFHWNNWIIAIVRYINPWLVMISLLVFYFKMIPDVIDGISELYDNRKGKPKHW